MNLLTPTQPELQDVLDRMLPETRLLAWRRAPDSNMNLVLRLETTQGPVILKQSRPYVEKYPQIAAPQDRALSEYEFYSRIRAVRSVATRMPKLLAFDREDMILLLEDLGDQPDCRFLYEGKKLSEPLFTQLCDWLNALHSIPQSEPLPNRDMRELNHEHIFVIPFASEQDPAIRESARELGSIYLSDGPCLLHGDFFPGSWLLREEQIFLFDPEFCFLGAPEFDWGVFAAHLSMASGQDQIGRVIAAIAGEDSVLVRRFAGVEILRRILGVAKVPIRADFQHDLIQLGRRAMLGL